MKRKGKEEDNGFAEWGGYMEAKKSKLGAQFDTEAQNSGLKEDDLFKDISIFVNGYTEPTADQLRLLMMKHGGIYHHYYKSGQTTHIIASNLPDSKVKLMSHLKVVKPQWITDSIQSKRVLNYQDYLLLTNQSKTQPILNFKPQEKSIKSATDEGFLEEFYNNSRLHHISSLGALFKDYILKLRSKTPYVFPGRDEIKNRPKIQASDCDDCTEKNVIMHIDMDCFFVSVGIRNRPELKGKPIAVTHAKGNRSKPREGTNPKQEIEAYREKKGLVSNDHWVNQLNEHDSMAEIASCSYAARQAGIKNGMFVGQALKLCPQLMFIHYNFEDYKEVSYILYNTVARYTLDIEAVSCDEMYADCSELLDAVDMTPMEFATLVRAEIKEKTGCPCSIGFGGNKLIARLATKEAKPDGQFHLKAQEVESFLKDKPVSDLPGVGRSTSHKLRENGVTTCGDLQNIPLSQLQKEFGIKLGETLHNASRGKFDKGLSFNQVRKSVSADVNYGIRFKSDAERDVFMKNLSQEVSSRLESLGMKGRSITLKLMVKSKNAPEETAKYLGHGVCDTITKGTSLSVPVSGKEAIFREVMKIFNNLKINSMDLRGIGIQITRLESVKKEGKDIMSYIRGKSAQIDKSKEPTEKAVFNQNDKKLSGPVEQNKRETIVYKVEEKPKKNNGVSSFVSPTEIRLLISQWVEAGKSPKQKDKLVVTEYLHQLINNRRFEDLHLILKSFSRCVSMAQNFPDAWKSTFSEILDSVQTVMLTVHKSRLKFNCELT